MPNYLDGDLSSESLSVVESQDPGSNFENVGNSRSTSVAFSAAGASAGFGAGTFSGQGPGSKPAAMHTEFAGESRSGGGGGGGGGGAYGTQDLVFYLKRCGSSDSESLGDQGDGAAGFSVGDDTGGTGAGRSAVWDDSSSSMVPVGAQGRSGPNPDNGEIQSGLNQIAMGRMGLGDARGGPMAPIAGFDFDSEVDLGEITQNAPIFSDININIVNAARRVKELSESVEKIGLGSSEKLFSRILNANFNPEFDSNAVRDSEDILDTFSRTSTSELAFLLAREVQGRIRNRDIVGAINDGKIGRLTERSRNFQSRMGNPGRAPR